MTYRKAYEVGRYILEEAKIDNPSGDAFTLLSICCMIDRTYYLTHEDTELTEEQKTQYRIMLTKRAEHIPLQYITGIAPFMGLMLKVNSSVLIPRFDTEVVVAEAIKLLKGDERVLDLCTGSGCIALALKNKFPMLNVVASDMSKAALNVAKENAKLYNMDIDFVKSDMFDKVKGLFDLIISNPPYIKSDVINTLTPEVRDFEPNEALDGMDDGLYFYRIIAENSKKYLKKGGKLVLEIGYDQGEEVSDMLFKNGFSPVSVIKDLAHLDRVIVARHMGES